MEHGITDMSMSKGGGGPRIFLAQFMGHDTYPIENITTDYGANPLIMFILNFR